jgi:hypothetical protein
MCNVTAKDDQRAMCAWLVRGAFKDLAVLGCGLDALLMSNAVVEVRVCGDASPLLLGVTTYCGRHGVGWWRVEVLGLHCVLSVQVRTPYC